MAIDKRDYFSFTGPVQRAIAQRQGYVCALCGTNLPAITGSSSTSTT
jgi:hypothetical protein